MWDKIFFLPFKMQCGRQFLSQIYDGTLKRGLQYFFQGGPSPLRGTFIHHLFFHHQQNEGREQMFCRAVYELTLTPKRA